MKKIKEISKEQFDVSRGVKIPWWSKMAAKLLLSRLPFDYSLWRRFRVFQYGEMARPSYAYQVFRTHIGSSGLSSRINGSTILELGPGDSILNALIAASYHAKLVLIDTGDYAIRDVDFYKKSVDSLVDLGLNPPDISRSKSRDDILTLCDARYLTNGLKSLESLEENSVDLIFSQAVLEHIRFHDFEMVMSECYRVLSNHGVASHIIDYKDHLGGGLNNLRFSKRLWESNFFTTSGFYTNRLRHHEVMYLMRKSGFDVETANTIRWNKTPINRRLLDKNFSSMSDEQLSIKEAHVILKPLQD